MLLQLKPSDRFIDTIKNINLNNLTNLNNLIKDIIERTIVDSFDISEIYNNFDGYIGESVYQTVDMKIKYLQNGRWDIVCKLIEIITVSVIKGLKEKNPDRIGAIYLETYIKEDRLVLELSVDYYYKFVISYV